MKWHEKRKKDNRESEEFIRRRSKMRSVCAAAGLIFSISMIFLAGCDAALTASRTSQEAQSQQTDDENKRGSGKNQQTVSVEVQGDMKADFPDIGKADCTVIRSSSQVMVIDTGYQETETVLLDYLESLGIDRIDHLILTHFDHDHVGGASALISKYEVGTIYHPDYSGGEENSKPYRRYVDTLQEYDLHPVTIKDDFTVVMEDVVFTIYPSEKLQYTRDKNNNRSLVTVVQHGDVQMLMTADAEKERIDEILTQIPDLESDLLKVPHHGHREKNSVSLFEAVNPRYAVICADCADKRNGPDDDIIKALENGGAQVLTTGDGAVKAVSDGRNFSVRQ